MEATYFFDPSCPFTWQTSRWLVQAAAERDVTLRWRPFSLYLLNSANPDYPEKYRQPALAAVRALRLVAALHEAGRDEETGRFYTEMGNRTIEKQTPLTDAIVDEAAEAAGLGDTKATLDDEAWDAKVRASHDFAYGSAGPGIGSPVLLIEGAERAVHGPIIGEPPARDDALALWDALVPLARIGTFFEVKRGR
jgi:predicted DsbA family dithiol-disulfide isomerase